MHDLTSVRSVLYRSEDSGKTWTNEVRLHRGEGMCSLAQMSKLKNSNDGVYEVLTTATDGKAWITGFGAFLWVTTDSGASYQTVNIPRASLPLFLPRTALTRTQRARRWWRSCIPTPTSRTTPSSPPRPPTRATTT